jgi:hypothetical protein
MSLSKLGNVILAILFASGWTWTDLLVTHYLIDENQRFWLLILLTIILAVQQLYLAIPIPAKRGIVEQRREIIKAQLVKFLTEYYKILRPIYSKRKHKKALPSVRVNVMLPTKKWRGVGGTYLQIYFCHCPEGIVFTDDEMTLKWKKGDGTGGWAWKNKIASIFDTSKPELRLPSARLKEHQSKVVSEIKSTLSIPIWLDNSVVGLLNLDSRQDGRYTFFTDVKVVALTTVCASVLAGQCPPDGVEG